MPPKPRRERTNSAAAYYNRGNAKAGKLVARYRQFSNQRGRGQTYWFQASVATVPLCILAITQILKIIVNFIAHCATDVLETGQ